MKQNQSTRKFWNIIADDSSDTAEIDLFGEIVSEKPIDFWTGKVIEGNYITPDGFKEELAKCKNKKNILIRLNSPGGDLFTGIAIHNALKGLSAHKTLLVEGIAASAASVIMCAGDDVQVYPGSIVMIHGVSSLIYDLMTLQDAKKLVKAMDSMEASIAEIYAAKTGKETDKLRNQITNETWFTGKQAVEAGFANTLLDEELTNKVQFVACAGGKFRVKTGDLPIPHNYFNTVPDDMKESVVTEENPDTETEPSEDDLKNRLAQAEQELVAAKSERDALKKEVEAAKSGSVESTENSEKIRVQAIADERKRLEEIDAIASGIDPELVRKAKYAKPMTAQELAFAALKDGKAINSGFLNARTADLQDSNTGKVGSESIETNTADSDLKTGIDAANKSTK
ncbi:Clp protease ClpP [Akkermansia sp. N21116]|uniref:head maturation protease, ClpP-related n=1 Tax=Akkermansia sp. N21116 TaxID=3040764 RepID=UPI00244E6265|nr:head maturation protease, ClpP-related [Akkermansia sp. N21116]WPX39434.1 Clp protease ClpP [Akkermansia sp. N21116]